MRCLIKDGNNERLKITFFLARPRICVTMENMHLYGIFRHFTTEIQIKIVETG